MSAVFGSKQRRIDDLEQQVRVRDERIESLTRRLAQLGNAATFAARALAKADATEIAALRQQVHAKDNELTLANRRLEQLHKQVDAAMGYDAIDQKRIDAHDHPFEVAT